MNEHDSNLPSGGGLQGAGSHEPASSGSDGTEGAVASAQGAGSVAAATGDRRRGSRKAGRKHFKRQAAAVGVKGSKANRAKRKSPQEPLGSLGSGVAFEGSATSTGPFPDSKLRKKPVRRVFGRVRVTVPERITFELTKRGLEARRWHKRLVKVITFVELANFTRNQGLLFPQEAAS